MIHDISWRTVSTLTCFRRTASDNSASRYCTSLRWAENSCHLIDDAPPTLWRGVGKGKKKATALCWRFVKFLQKEKFLISCTSHGSSQLLSMRDSLCWLGEWPPPAPCQNHAFLVCTPNNPKTTNGEKWRCFRVYQLVLVTSIWEVVKCAQMTLMPYDHHYPTPNVCIRATTCTSWSSHFWALADDPAPGTAWQIVEVLHGWFEVTRGSCPEVTKHCSSF